MNRIALAENEAEEDGHFKMDFGGRTRGYTNGLDQVRARQQ